ncbi:MAG: hypothetical protein ACE5JK_07260 [Candidatus Omnitrophota bacterium]
MKKAVVVVLAIGLLLTCASTGQCQQEKINLYSELWDVKDIKVYVADVTDSSGAAGDMVRGIKKELEAALDTRMSLDFEIVNNENDADLVITTDVVERVWMDHDPIDTDHLPPSWVSVLVDAAQDDDYGRIQAIMVVKHGPNRGLASELRKLKRRNIIWRKEVSADVTQHEMTEEQSKPILEQELAAVFIRKCFSKNAKMYK